MAGAVEPIVTAVQRSAVGMKRYKGISRPSFFCFVSRSARSVSRVSALYILCHFLFVTLGPPVGEVGGISPWMILCYLIKRDVRNG